MLAPEEALQLGGQLVPRREIAEGGAGQPLFSFVLRFQLSDQGGVLVASGDQLVDLLVGGGGCLRARAAVSSSRSARLASPSSRAAAAAGYGMADT